MDTANLAFAHIAAALFGSFLFTGVGLVIGRRVFPHFKLHQKATKNLAPVSRNEPSLATPGENGRLLPTEIVGLEGNIIRYRDGSFGKASASNRPIPCTTTAVSPSSGSRTSRPF